ncbi:MAG: tetratricopeptide repeat protein [Acidobacteriia bacterium]|nr:tetratricopeptide repeat protein [Terriglobia bacterium]
MRILVLLAWALCCAAQEDDPAAGIRPLIEAGNAGFMRGDYPAARQSFEKAWDLALQTAPDNPLRYDVLKRLTSVRAAAGEFADADRYLQIAMDWRETIVGPDDPKMVDDMLVSVGLSRGMKDYTRALAILGRVMARHARDLGFGSTALADDFSREAQIYVEREDPESAARSLTTALRYRTQSAGALDVSLVYDLDRLGGVYLTLRAYDKAEEAFRHALVIRETLFGREHGDLIASLDGLCYSLFGQKKYAEAEPLYQRLLALWIKSVGKEHPMVAIALDKIAVFYADQKKYDQAKEASGRANAIRAYSLATGLSVEAAEQIGEGNKERATALMERALVVLDPPDPVYDELRAQTEKIVKSLDPKVQPKTPPPKKKP